MYFERGREGGNVMHDSAPPVTKKDSSPELGNGNFILRAKAFVYL